MREIGSENNEIIDLKREIARLKNAAYPLASTLNQIRESEKERKRLDQEIEGKKHLKLVAENALRAENNEATQKFLERLIESTQFSIARIEIKRRY
jgi:ribosomal 50S subunit-associated protein YjgA (DUF615 family)